MTARENGLVFYWTQIDLTQDRIRLLETRHLRTEDIEPRRDTTLETIESDRLLLANYQRGLDILLLKEFVH